MDSASGRLSKIVEGWTVGVIEPKAELSEVILGRFSSSRTVSTGLFLFSPWAHTLRSARPCLTRARRRPGFHCPGANADPR